MSYTTPVILTCKLTGHQQKLYFRPYIDKLIEKHGSLEKVQENYKPKSMRGLKLIEQPAAIAAAKVAVRDTVSVPFDGVHRQYNGGKTIDGDDVTVNVYESK